MNCNPLMPVVMVAWIACVAAPAQEQATVENDERAAQMAAAMQAAQQAMVPGDAHKALSKLEGAWTTQSKLTLAGQPPQENEGTATIETVLGGRFIREESEGTMMGMPFTAHKLLGFNKGSKKYEGVWMYTMGTSMMRLDGTSENDGKTITCDASWDNAIGVRENVTITYSIVDDDHFNITMGGGKMPDGSPGPEMEISYTRKK